MFSLILFSRIVSSSHSFCFSFCSFLAAVSFSPISAIDVWCFIFECAWTSMILCCMILCSTQKRTEFRRNDCTQSKPRKGREREGREKKSRTFKTIINNNNNNTLNWAMRAIFQIHSSNIVYIEMKPDRIGIRKSHSVNSNNRLAGIYR